MCLSKIIIFMKTKKRSISSTKSVFPWGQRPRLFHGELRNKVECFLLSPLFLQFALLFYLVCMGILPVCCVLHTCRGQKRAFDHLELELEME